jgi:hypothetical protein
MFLFAKYRILSLRYLRFIVAVVGKVLYLCTGNPFIHYFSQIPVLTYPVLRIWDVYPGS